MWDRGKRKKWKKRNHIWSYGRNLDPKVIDIDNRGNFWRLYKSNHACVQGDIYQSLCYGPHTQNISCNPYLGNELSLSPTSCRSVDILQVVRRHRPICRFQQCHHR